VSQMPRVGVEDGYLNSVGGDGGVEGKLVWVRGALTASSRLRSGFPRLLLARGNGVQAFVEGSRLGPTWRMVDGPSGSQLGEIIYFLFFILPFEGHVLFGVNRNYVHL